MQLHPASGTASYLLLFFMQSTRSSEVFIWKWGAWNLTQANVSALKFDFGDWANQCFREYPRMKAIRVIK